MNLLKNLIHLAMELLKEKNIRMFIGFMIIFSGLLKIIKSLSLYSGRNKLIKIQMRSSNNLFFAKIRVLKINKMDYLKSISIILLLDY